MTPYNIRIRKLDNCWQVTAYWWAEDELYVLSVVDEKWRVAMQQVKERMK